jgi:pyruvate,water dikinase
MNNFKKFSADELNRRFRFSVMHAKDGKIKIYTDGRAKEFLKKQQFEKVVINKTDELSGTPAYVGKVKGKVKIINLPEEMAKMEQDDIMVSHTTFPSLVPAMKKAAAIVTDDGGITCHAAIVARELKIPCIVGTKIATKVLKDGDLVEVDASAGIIKNTT